MDLIENQEIMTRVDSGPQFKLEELDNLGRIQRFFEDGVQIAGLAKVNVVTLVPLFSVVFFPEGLQRPCFSNLAGAL